MWLSHASRSQALPQDCQCPGPHPHSPHPPPFPPPHPRVDGLRAIGVRQACFPFLHAQNSGSWNSFSQKSHRQRERDCKPSSLPSHLLLCPAEDTNFGPLQEAFLDQLCSGHLTWYVLNPGHPMLCPPQGPPLQRLGAPSWPQGEGSSPSYSLRADALISWNPRGRHTLYAHLQILSYSDATRESI